MSNDSPNNWTISVNKSQVAYVYNANAKTNNVLRNHWKDLEGNCIEAEVNWCFKVWKLFSRLYVHTNFSFFWVSFVNSDEMEENPSINLFSTRLGPKNL